MNDLPTSSQPAITLLDVLKLYEQRFMAEGIAMRLNVKQHKITGMLGKHGLTQANVMKRLRAGETPEQIAASATLVTKTASGIPGAVTKAALAFVPVFDKVAAGSALPAPLAEAYAALKKALTDTGALSVEPSAAVEGNPPFIAREMAAQQAAGQQQDPNYDRAPIPPQTAFKPAA